MTEHNLQGVALLRQLRGPALPVLVAMVLSGADAVAPSWISAATGLTVKTVVAGLRSLDLLGYVRQLSTHRWELSTGHQQLGLFSAQSRKIFDLQGSGSGDESVLGVPSSTTTTAESGKIYDLGGSPVDNLLKMGCPRDKAVAAVNAALKRGETAYEIRGRISSCAASSFKPRQRGLWAAACIKDGRALPAPEARGALDPSAYDGYLPFADNVSDDAA